MHLGLIGTGLMGRPMGARLIDAGHQLTVWNRTREKAEPLAKLGGKVADEPAQVFAAGEATVVMLADGDAVKSALQGASLDGHTLLQMSTISPGESRQIAELVDGAGGQYLEAPVLGSTPQAESGDLIVMAGGSRELFDRWHDVLAAMGENPRHVGQVGQAAALKLALNQLIASETAAFAYSLGLVQKSGLEVETFMEILRGSPLYAEQFEKKLPRLLSGDFSDPNFPLKHLRKDVALCLAAGGPLGLGREPLQGVLTVVERGLDLGLGEGDYCALHDAINPREGEAET